MPNIKILYIDIYHSIFDDDGLTIKDLIHLHKMNITTGTDIGEVVDQLKLHIFKQYGDGFISRQRNLKIFVI